jgi:hypothetical protein
MHNEAGKPLYPLNEGTPPLSRMNVSAISFRNIVVTPGFMKRATSAKVFPTSKELSLINLISDSDFTIFEIKFFNLLHPH